MRRSSALGRYGEEIAVGILESAGLCVVERNWRCEVGEIDIIAREGSTLVVVEVKTRSSLAFGHPLEAITPRKMRRLRNLAFRWMVAHDVHVPCVRLDAIGILQLEYGPPVIEYLRGVE